MLADNVRLHSGDAFRKAESQEVAARFATSRNRERRRSCSICVTPCGRGVEGIPRANLFLDHGTITICRAEVPKQAFKTRPRKDVTKLPVAVLVNRGTAGPAEIVASAILRTPRRRGGDRLSETARCRS